MRKSFKVNGIDCANCAAKLERNIAKIKGVESCAVVFATQKLVLEAPDDKFDAVIAVETYYFWPDKLGDLKEIYRVLKRGGRLMLVFEMLRDDRQPDRWKAVEERLGIEAVSREGIEDMLFRAGYLNIRTHVRSGTTWLCAIAEKE